MRLQLIPACAPAVRPLGLGFLLTLGLLSSLTNLSHAQERDTGDGEIHTRTLVYDDDDATTVISSYAGADVTLPGKIVVGAHVLLDSVSSASVDVVSAATTRWEEDRVEVGATFGTIVSGQEFSLGVVRSEENDWRSLSLQAGTAREFFQRNTRVSASFAFTNNDVGRARDPNFEESLTSTSMELGIGQLIDQKTRIGGAYSFQRLNGFQSSPYRFVSTLDGSTMAELHPGTRLRHAISGFAMRSLHESTSVRVGYRLYRDDWGIWSHTATLGLRFAFAKHFGATLDGRFYQQNRADFYRNNYQTTLRYMSFDRELSTFRDTGAHMGLTAKLGPALVDIKAGIIRYRFRNFDPLPKRRALLLGGGLKLLW